MDNKNADKVRGISAAFSRLFSSSLTSDILARMRVGALRLRLRVIGVFLSTFGIYSLIASLIANFFTKQAVGDSAVYFGICISVASIPLLVSSDNISTGLTESRFGAGLCSFFGIQTEAVQEEKCIGRLNAGFVLGVIAGTLTLVFSPVKITLFLLLAFAAVMILIMPRIGPAVNMAGLFIFDKKIHCFIIIVTALSLIIKLVRGKHSIRPGKADIIPLIFMLSVTAGFAFSLHDGRWVDIIWYFIIISSYFMSIYMYNDCRRITRLASVACIFAAFVSCAYIAGQLVSFAFRFAVPDSGALSAAINSLYVFKTGSAPALLAALIPLSVGLAMLRHNIISPSSMWLSAAVMACSLIVMGRFSHLAAAAVSTIVLLLIIGRKSIYATLAILLGLAAVFMYTDIGMRLYTNIFKIIAEDSAAPVGFFQKLRSMGKYLLCGRGFAASGGTECNLYAQITEAIGIAGLTVFAAFIIYAVISFTGLAKRTITSDISSAELRRFGAIRSAADTRIGAASPLMAGVSLLICGLFNDLTMNSVSFMLIWILFGMCVSYSRSADSELNKAKEASYFRFSSDAAAIDIPADLKIRGK